MTLDEVPATVTAQDRTFDVIKGQVAKILLEHAGDGCSGHRRLAQRDIAAMLNTGWASVHLSLMSLYREGVIRIERNRIIINKELLEKTAGAQQINC